jgi:hypothetical protein
MVSIAAAATAIPSFHAIPSSPFAVPGFAEAGDGFNRLPGEIPSAEGFKLKNLTLKLRLLSSAS